MYTIFLLASLLSLISNTSHAQSLRDEGIYYYYQGQQAGGRFEGAGTLSEAQIQQVIAGFEAALRNQPSRYSSNDFQRALEMHHEALRAKNYALGQQNLQAGERYLAELEANPEYHFLDQGMAYRIDTPGTGDVPSKDSQVRLQYIGKHIDESEFDRSTSPIWMSIQGMLPGWRLALREMPAGSQWTLVIPPHLAYGELGAADRVGPYETLVFEVHLLEVR